MKLQNKLVFYNTFSKVIIILSIGLTLPVLIQQVVYDHTDARLIAKRDKVMDLIKQGGILEITKDEDCSYGNYNILKEEYIAVYPLKSAKKPVVKIENAKRDIEGEIFTQRVLSQPFFYDNQYYVLEIGRDMSTIYELNNTIKRFTILVLIIVITISIMIDIGFTQLTLIPFKKIIQNKLKNVKHPTAFDTTPIRTTTDDFKHLDQSLNEMMITIKDAFLVEKEFIANVSHELLTPISILQGRLENILIDTNLPEDLGIKIVDSLKILNRLTRIIKALLLISKIENDQYLKTDTVPVAQILNEVMDDIEERLTEKEISVETLFEEDFTIRNCNKTLLHQLFFNIINNAIKYNKPHGRISIHTFTDSRGNIVEVQDTGIGIEAENLDLIFNRFKKFDTDDKDSHGLGLPIVKTISNFHNVDITVESEVQKGSIFRLIFKK